MLSEIAQVIDELHRIMSILSSKTLLQAITVSGSERNRGGIWLAALRHQMTRNLGSLPAEKTNAGETASITAQHFQIPTEHDP
jgi:hypothetical protein